MSINGAPACTTASLSLAVDQDISEQGNDDENQQGFFDFCHSSASRRQAIHNITSKNYSA
jgi:hypothetical protein